jgi:uncharacterized protein YjbI with pentapeptide repeats
LIHTIINYVVKNFKRLSKRERLREQLLEMFRENNATAHNNLSTISSLSANGFLVDGKSMNGVDLSGLDFHNCSFQSLGKEGGHEPFVARDVNFSNASLKGVDMRDAIFHNTNFSHAELQLAWLMNADLTGSVFDYANIEGAVLLHATLTGCSFKGTKMEYTTFSDGTKWYDSYYLNEYEEMPPSIRKHITEETFVYNRDIYCSDYKDYLDI